MIWLYLEVVINLYSRLAVGWAMSERMTAQLMCDALQMALWRRRMPTGALGIQIAGVSTVPVPTGS